MKKLLIILLLFLTACEGMPYKIINIYYDNVYVVTETQDMNDKNTIYTNNTEITFNEIQNAFCIYGKCLPQQLDVYQDSEKSCLLFSYSGDELSKMIISSEEKTSSDDYIFVVGHKSIDFVPVIEIEKIMNDIKPHSYDLSLCKK